MAFKLLSSPYPGDPTEKITVASVTAVAGDLLYVSQADPSVWTVATASGIEHWHRKAVATAAIASGDTSALVTPVLPGQKWLADSTNDAVAADLYDRQILTDGHTVNNTSSNSTDSSAIFTQLGYAGALTDKKLVGAIAYGSGVDPDAT